MKIVPEKGQSSGTVGIPYTAAAYMSYTWISDLTPVEVASFESEDKSLGSSDIGSNRNVVDITKSEEVHIVHISSLRVDWVSEEEKHIYLVARKQCKNLFSTAASAQVALDRQSSSLTYLLSCSISSHKSMLGEDSAVSTAELYHELLFGIMGNDRDFHFSVLSPPSGITFILSRLNSQRNEFSAESLGYRIESLQCSRICRYRIALSCRDSHLEIIGDNADELNADLVDDLIEVRYEGIADDLLAYLVDDKALALVAAVVEFIGHKARISDADRVGS